MGERRRKSRKRKSRQRRRMRSVEAGVREKVEAEERGKFGNDKK